MKINWDQIVTDINQGMPDYELREKRKPICESCEYLNSMNICDKCLCIIPLKTLWHWAECPLKKW